MHSVKDLRNSFIEFFRERDHTIVPSSSLIPKDDPTLLFTTAGMVQFKPMFAGTVKLEYTRAASIQKCFRTSDLERVGKTKRHCTFFEMLGNFSFGDYFKKEAIEYAWEYSTQVIGFPKEDIWVSIFELDDEAFEIWNKRIGIPERKIVRLGKEDNFWGPAGDSGACGPCSELYLDRGPAFGCGSHDCKPGCDCERFLEYWNLVFNQFFQEVDGTQRPLPRTGIDTGMGLERLATLVQNVDSIYDTDELKQIVEFVTHTTKTPYSGTATVSINTMVEHARALTFLIADGAYPSNEGRGYVLRRLIRRALRFARLIGIQEPFLYRMVEPIVNIMGNFYPEIISASSHIKNILEGEEKRFLETLENGMDRLNEIIADLKIKGNTTIPGTEAFVLYDTYGFPLEMTVEIAHEEGLTVDVNGFEMEMSAQRERGKKSWKMANANRETLIDMLHRTAGETVFLGYEHNSINTTIVALANNAGLCDFLAEGSEGMVVTRETAFYGESGGQVGDTGHIVQADGARFEVMDTIKENGTIIHLGKVTHGTITTGKNAITEIDAVRRNLIRANHTATHLLNAALHAVLGNHVKQSGSVVDPARLRFDFTHFNPMTTEEIEEVERIVNLKIWEAHPVITEIMELEKALQTGAFAVFDEKYENTVRVVSVPNFSKELCGGTHVDNTAKIGVFKIIREASPGAGLRRIEAVTLKGLLERYNSYSSIISTIMMDLNITEDGIVKKTEELLARVNALEKELEKMRFRALATNIDSILQNARNKNGVKIILHNMGDAAIDELRKLSDLIRAKENSSVVLLGSQHQGKPLLLFAATKSAVEKGIDCGAIIKETSKLVGGGGGGRKEMAQAGGKNPDKLEHALQEAARMAERMIK
ncbi:MAG: alanine--tRNA ligase [Spirochaetes bacterium]|nr:alanine--tRNA ligase [Spirochaetota bacterium]